MQRDGFLARAAGHLLACDLPAWLVVRLLQLEYGITEAAAKHAVYMVERGEVQDLEPRAAPRP